MQIKIMKFGLIIISGLIVFASCSNNFGKEGKRELVPNPGKYVHDGYLEQSKSHKTIFRPDTAIGKISLINSRNIDIYLGSDVMERLVDKGLPSASVISNDSKQRLIFYLHPGDLKKEFSEFKVNYVDQKERNEFVSDDNEFVTESGIKLGMTMGEFRSIKGEPDSVSNGETVIFHYKIDDYKNSNFLKKYNMPLYYSDYEFKQGYLTEFKFGFEYP